MVRHGQPNTASTFVGALNLPDPIHQLPLDRLWFTLAAYFLYPRRITPDHLRFNPLACLASTILIDSLQLFRQHWPFLRG
jgi:hypothetical protein